jgi:hypothetical protein
VLRADHMRRLVPAAGVAVVAAVLALLLLDRGGRVDLVMKAAGIASNASGLGGFVNGAHALVTPALVMAAAIAPLTLVVGGVVLMFGGRRGMQIVGTSPWRAAAAGQRDGAASEANCPPPSASNPQQAPCTQPVWKRQWTDGRELDRPRRCEALDVKALLSHPRPDIEI